MELPQRAKEVKFGLYINYLKRVMPDVKFSTIAPILGCLSRCMGSKEYEQFIKVYSDSLFNNNGGASNKDIATVISLFFSVNQGRKLLGIATPTYKRDYEGLFDDELDIATHLVSMKPTLEEDSVPLLDTLIKFLEQFRVATKNSSNTSINDLTRTLEIDFYFIYKKLIEIFNNELFARNFIEQVCYRLDINFPSINKLMMGMYKLDRRYPSFLNAHGYFVNEVVTLYTARGYTKSYIGEKILGYTKQYLLSGSCKRLAKPFEGSELSALYHPALEYLDCEKQDIIKFIALFHNISDYLDAISIRQV